MLRMKPDTNPPQTAQDMLEDGQTLDRSYLFTR